jgi:hypothetical protein
VRAGREILENRSSCFVRRSHCGALIREKRTPRVGADTPELGDGDHVRALERLTATRLCDRDLDRARLIQL